LAPRITVSSVAPPVLVALAMYTRPVVATAASAVQVRGGSIPARTVGSAV
jgi:hypothetical protein